jgi:hypothetical protein
MSSAAVHVQWAYCPGCRVGNHIAHQAGWVDDDRRVPCPCGCAGGPAPRRRLDLDAIRDDLAYAGSGIDGADLPYHPHALAAMRAAEALLAEVEWHRTALAPVRRLAEALHRIDTTRVEADCPIADYHGFGRALLVALAGGVSTGG